MKVKNGIEIITEMRKEQIKADNSTGWDSKFFKTTNQDRIKALARAGVVIVEEIDRLLELEKNKKKTNDTDWEKVAYCLAKGLSNMCSRIFCDDCCFDNSDFCPGEAWDVPNTPVEDWIELAKNKIAKEQNNG